MTAPLEVDPPPPDDDETADYRRLAQWVVVAGLALGLAAAAFLIWEAWSANRDALEHNRRQEEADVIPFTGGGGAPPPAAGAPAGPGGESS